MWTSRVKRMDDTQDQKKAADAKIVKSNAANNKALKENANQIAALKKLNAETQTLQKAQGDTMSKISDTLAAIQLKLEKP